MKKVAREAPNFDIYNMITYIYALYDIREPDIVRYVGKSNDPKRRIKDHIRESKKSNTYKSNWIKSFDAEKFLAIKILSSCEYENYEEMEEYYVKKYKSEKLTNSDETGQGNIGRKKELIDLSIAKISKKVYRFNLDGKIIDCFPSTREASRELNISHSLIIRCCNGEYKHSSGFIFSYEDTVNTIVKIPNAVKKRVVEVDFNGNKINEWKSLMDCARDTGIDNGNISRVCNGKLVSIKKRYFRFL